jgi:crossover junction endodeoxyribonuclease RuvC
VGISLKQYEALCKKIVTGSQGEDLLEKPGLLKIKIENATILGIDPSLRGTGYGIIKVQSQNLRSLVYGTISCPKDWNRSQCILKIAEELRKTITDYKPELCVMEGIFYAQNRKTALIMGEARGASILVAAESGLEIFEIAPRRIKQALTGHGGASKVSVAKMVQRILNLNEQPEPDAADALAVAIAYAQECSTFLPKSVKHI